MIHLTIDKYLFWDLKKSCDKFDPDSKFILIDKFDLEELKLCAWSLRVIEFFDEYKDIIDKIINGDCLFIELEKEKSRKILV